MGLLAGALALAAVPSAWAQSGQAAFETQCRQALVAADPAARKWADAECRERWAHVVAAGPLADAVLALAPRAAGQAPGADEIKRRLPAVQWQRRPERGALASGRVAPDFGVDVRRAAGTPAPEVSFGWRATGEPVRHDLPEALRQRGARIETLACQSFGSGEDLQVLKVAAPGGGAPYAVTVSRRNAPTAHAWSLYSAGVDPSGRLPTLAQLRQRDGGSWQARCAS